MSMIGIIAEANLPGRGADWRIDCAAAQARNRSDNCGEGCAQKVCARIQSHEAPALLFERGRCGLNEPES